MSLLTSVTHCGSFPMLMSLYYSYRRGLPAVVSKIQMKKGGDIRYSSGNHPVGHVRSKPFEGDFGDFILSALEGNSGGYNFVSGNFRTSPNLEATDSLPIAITREFLKPGIMAYNADGHCLVVGKVDDSGEVHFLDSHPDHSITFNQTLSALPLINSTSTDNIDSWYDGFKIIRLAKIADEKSIPFSNEEMKQFGFSLEQYETMIKIKAFADKTGFEINGKKVKFYPQFIRARLQQGKEAPLSYLELSCQELGSMFRERASFVQEGWKNVLEYGSIEFPNDSATENIYQADSAGRWEVWSSPSSDVDRRQKYNYLATRLEEMIEGFPNATGFDYQGFSSKKELVKRLLEKKNELFSNEIIFYKNSKEEDVPLTLIDVEKRLFDLSFDPNHCPELRWGAPENSPERTNMKLINVQLKTGEFLTTLKSYDLERGLRYYPERQTTPTSLDPEKNPKEPPFKLIEERLEKYLE